MIKKFSPSINIERDTDQQFDFIATPNVERVISDIDYDFNNGIHSFSIIGSYGTGKSSFFWALEKHILSEKKFKTQLKSIKKNCYEFIKISSEYTSLNTNIHRILNTDKRVDLITAINEIYKKALKKNKGIILLIDEFGKVLEYAAKHEPEKEVFELQRLAEYASSKNILLVTSLHQSFESYAFELNKRQRDEWSKVKGRFKEVPFNEPIEQLLFLAATKINNGKKEPPRHLQLLKTINESKAFPFRIVDESISKKLFPIDLLAASTLTLALQRYGQNERSLFTFLNSNVLTNVSSKTGYFGLPDIYDYLFNNFYHYLTSRYNVDFVNWQSINSSIQRARSVLGDNFQEIDNIIKTIGLLAIFASKGACINERFITRYLSITYNTQSVEKQLAQLIKYKIIKYLKYKNTFVLFEGTDIDIEYELTKIERKGVFEFNIVEMLKKYLNLTPILARYYYYEFGTPRYYDFVISDNPINNLPVGELDGFINIIFNQKLSKKEILNFSADVNEAILYGHVKNSDEIKNHVLEIEKVNYLYNSEIIKNDLIAQRELIELKNYHTERLNNFIENQFFNKKFISWYYNGKEVEIGSKYIFNRYLSNICKEVYSSTPFYKNELINREDLPGNISKARRELLVRLFDHWDKENLNFPKDKFPPEKTIYLSLLKNTGIHRQLNNAVLFDAPNEKTFLPLWNVCEKFINESKNSKKNLSDLVEILSNKPFKLRNGFIDFWLSLWLFIKRNDFALYDQTSFIPELSVETIDLILKKPANYYLKAFDLGGIHLELFNKYRELINKESEYKADRKTFIETIKPFLSFYKALPEYTKKTKRLSSKSIRVREAIVNAKDPEQTFFEDFPNALGFTTNELHDNHKKLEKFINELKNSIKELRTAYDELVNRIETAIKEEFGYQSLDFIQYKKTMQKRFSSIKSFSLLPHQKIVYQRIYSNLDDRDSWINSFVQSMVGKQIAQISDEDEESVYKKIRTLKYEFDNLCEFANLNIDEHKEDAVKIEISSLSEGINSKIIRLPKNRNGKYEKIENIIRKELEKDYSKDDKIFLLLKLLKEELNEN
jgi:hypothetical protein